MFSSHLWPGAKMFSLSAQPLKREELHQQLSNSSAGAIVVFEGWVRNHNEGKAVKSLEYQVYHALALKEGQRILDEAKKKFNLHAVMAVHREGHLALGDIAIWIGATASHRDDAFKATRFVIDEIKHRLPVWKKEHYVSGPAEWVICRHHHHHVHFTESDYYQKNLADQSKLKYASVLVVGAGGLGCPVLVGLASAGVGKITITDPDVISISNIHRQFLYAPNLVGEKKVVVAARRLRELNPFIEIEEKAEWFGAELIQHDLVIDCTDNMRTKFQIHDACLMKRVPLISASVFKAEGQLRTIIPGEGCLRCFMSEAPDDSLLGNCNDNGVLGTTVNTLGSMQAAEALAWLQTGKNSTSEKTLFISLNDLSQNKIKNTKRDGCQACVGNIVMDNLEVTSVVGTLVDIRKDFELPDGPITLMCNRGNRSLRTTKELRAKGRIEVYSLKGGYNANFNPPVESPCKTVSALNPAPAQKPCGTHNSHSTCKNH